MPNIIEQQDLLKGLPDSRIALLLQNPVPSIPPFLVAAEAQRRQAIRQQFAANAPQESVVESLTKQLANVPQNIQAPAQRPPNVPPTPQMQGVMALQQQQAMQQAAQQVMPQQQMNAGGMVQRYQVGGQVTPWWTIPDYSGAIPKVMDWVGSTSKNLYDLATMPYSEMQARKEEQQKEQAKRDAELLPIAPTGEIPPGLGRTDEMALPDWKVPRRTTPTANENPTPPPAAEKKPDETEDQFRARLAALYDTGEVSDWDKAQRWFAMAEQFLDPSKTTMQSVAGAGRAFADAAAAQSRAEREAQLQGEKAVLEYDMTLAEAKRAAAAEAAKDEREFRQKMQERGTPTADAAINAIIRSMSDADKEIADLTKDLTPGVPPSPEIQARISAIQNYKSGLNRQLVSIMDRGGFANRKIVTEEELAGLGPL